MSGGSQQAGTTTTTNAPYSAYQPYIGTALGQAGNLLQSGGPQYYPGQQVASFNPLQSQAFGGIQSAANSTGALSRANAMDKTLMQGSGNPFENQMFQQEMQQVQPQLASQFAGSGRDIVGSMPLAQQQLGNMGAQFYGQQYQNDVNNALNAGNQAQSLYDTRLSGQQQLLGAGNQIQGQSQALIDASKNAYNYNQNLPYQNLQRFEGAIAGLMPGTGQQSNPYFTNPSANLLGGALAGQQLYNGMGSKPQQGMSVNSIANDGSSLNNFTPITQP